MRERARSDEELDLVPVMNLVAILIPFLLLSAQFVPLAAIENTLPAVGPQTEPTDTPPLELAIAVTERGYVLSSAAWEEPMRVSCVGGFCKSPTAWDTRELQDLLAGLKRDWPEEDLAILRVDGEVPYEVLVATLDASRKTADGDLLFPRSAIAGGL